MGVQVNVRVPQPLLEKARAHAEKHGYRSVQELIREAMRDKLEPALSAKEAALAARMLAAADEKELYGTEQELFEKLRG